MKRSLCLLAVLFAACAHAPRRPAAPHALRSVDLTLAEAGEVRADIEVRCGGCDWGRRGAEAAVLRLDLDGRYAQHLVLARGSARYAFTLGRLAAGAHRLDVVAEPQLGSPHAGEVEVAQIDHRVELDADARTAAVAHAPLLYLRADTLPAFTDLPLVMWYEEQKTEAGRWLRYSVIFSNEDGGTPPDRLMATWGRVTDIEYVYGVELGADGRVLREEYQAPKHELLPFQGRKEDGHPLLWVATANNMVAPEGTTAVRMALDPQPFDLTGTSREAVMDANPWTYALSAREVRREGRVREGAAPGSKQIPDPRRFVTVEACASLHDAALAFALGVRRDGGATDWIWSDAGPLAWRIVRSVDNGANGCFRGAVAVPEGAAIAGVRFRSWPRPRREGEPPLPDGAGTAVLRSITRLFPMGDDDRPGRSLLSWSGALEMDPSGPPVELPVPPPAS